MATDLALPTPLELHVELTEIIQQETGVSATWEQHKQPLGITETARIFTRIDQRMRELLNLSARAEIETPQVPSAATPPILDEGSDAPGI